MKTSRCLNVLAVGSLVLFVGVMGFWIASHRWHTPFRFHGPTGLSSFSPADGRITIVGPPDEGRDDPATAALAAQMSNDDFQWSAPLDLPRGRVVRGEPREDSPTRRMFEQFQHRRDALPAPDFRLWLRTMENRNAFVPAHLMLSLAAVHWRDAGVWPGGTPYLYMPIDKSGTGPDLSAWHETKESWHRELDETLYDLSYAWLAAIALIFPLIRVTRPRRAVAQSPILQRWSFNGASLVSMIAFLWLTGLWWRSYRTVSEWQLSRKYTGEPVAAGLMIYNGTWIRYRWFGNADGRLQLLERTVYEPTFEPHPDYRNNYWIIGSPRNEQAYRRYVFNSSGGWLKSSINYFSAPPSAAGTQPPTPSFVRQVPLPIPVPVIPPASVGVTSAIPTSLIPEIDPLLLQLQTEMQICADATKAESEALAASPPDRGGAQVARWTLNDHNQRIMKLRLAVSDLFRRARSPAVVVASPLPKASSGARTIVVSFWVIVLPTLILPLTWLCLSARRRVRQLRDQCPVCGYDLRATPDRCPECGTVRKGAAE